MITAALNHLSTFPVWIQQVTLVLRGLVIMAALAASLIKIMQTPSMQAFFRATRTLFERIGLYLKKQMDDPTAPRKPGRIALFANIAIAYLMSGLLVFIAVCFTVLWACLHQRISVEKTLVLFAYIFLCWYVAAVLKAQGGRDRMKL
jgi:hypothetical protein